MPTTKKVRALIIHGDGNAEVKAVNPDARVLQSTVGGWLEGIYPSDQHTGDWHGYVDEEGKLKAYAINVAATAFCGDIGWSGRGADVLCGTVILLGTDGPDETDVPTEVVEEARAFFGGLLVEEAMS